jgi:hypothetical protein
MRRARKLMPLLLPRAERKLRRRVLRETPPLAGDAPLAWPNADLQVY